MGSCTGIRGPIWLIRIKSTTCMKGLCKICIDGWTLLSIGGKTWTRRCIMPLLSTQLTMRRPTTTTPTTIISRSAIISTRLISTIIVIISARLIATSLLRSKSNRWRVGGMY
ncbi:hypothetical protein HanPSC8_Chr12g0541901 [Helianthus annuus]|nr:hypothetical protein HanPSC8_Chr12g0541901 [Helianthus annuus]